MDENSIKYLVDPPYPPTTLGRYARWLQKASWRDPGEPADRIGCVWKVAPCPPGKKADIDYCACIECGRVLIGWGHPMDEKRPWLPAWPAGLFPLGVSREHLIGWRGLVLAAVSYDPEPAYAYVPKVGWGYPRGDAARDDWECGWLPLVRATRQLGRHYDLITNDRLLAPYPGTRYDARPDVEPILDELVRFASAREATTGPSPASRPEEAVLLPAHGHAQPDRPRWDAGGRTLYFGDRPVKRYEHHPADAQVDVLDAFEKVGWPDAIASGLEDDKKRNTIRDLNKSLGVESPITFHGNGTKTGISWKRKSS